MRPRTACSACRQRQRKCVGGDESRSLACQFCIRNQHECSLVSVLRATTSPTGRETLISSPPDSDHSNHSPLLLQKSTSREIETLNPQPITAALPPLAVCLEVVSAYFVYIHDPSQYLFHRPSFIADLVNGVVPRPLLLCIIALAARFSTHHFFAGQSPRTRANVYAREAETLLDLHDPTILTLQTVILLGTFYGTEGDSLHENLYYSLACRLGHLLDLPGCLMTTPLNRELGIRLWWTLDMIDIWASSSIQLPRLLVPKDDTPYPISEESFLKLRQTHTFDQYPLGSSLELRYADSILLHKIKLSSLMPEIIELNKTAAGGSMKSHDLYAATEALVNRLHEWERDLPESLTNTPENMITQAASGAGGAFVSLHIGFFHYSQLLFFPFLHQPAVDEEHLDEAQRFAEHCRVSSTALCELLYSAQALPGAEVHYSMVGHALVISSTVQLHILLFGENELHCLAARRRLEKNFLLLSNLQKLWRTIDHSFGRFTEFHAACVRSKITADDPGATFKLDKWMLKFLLEFSKPVEQRRLASHIRSQGQSQGQSQSRSHEANVAHMPNGASQHGHAGLWSATHDGIEFDFRQWSLVELGIDLSLEP